MPRYEKRTASGVAFIDVRIRDKTIHTSTGRVGAKPTRKMAKLKSVRSAQGRFLPRRLRAR